MPKRPIANEQMPKALGPYSQAVAASGELVFVSGQAGLDSEGRAPENFEQQARNAFDNLARVIGGAGLTLADIVKTTIYLSDAGHFQALNVLFAEYFTSSPPTRAVPIVQLPKGLLISIEAIAVRP
jgi:2-iminobutanoate/2-iminopropanoate deaminase